MCRHDWVAQVAELGSRLRPCHPKTLFPIPWLVSALSKAPRPAELTAQGLRTEGWPQGRVIGACC